MLVPRMLATAAVGCLAVLGMAAAPAAAQAGDPILNGGFETGSFYGWTTSGAATTIVSSGEHSGLYAAMAGSTSPTAGDSNIIQTFTAEPGDTTLSFWYNVTCDDSLNYDWAAATLTDNTSGTTATPLAPTCVPESGWQQVTTTVMAGHSYTLTLTSHDDNNPGDPTYTLFDDVAVGSSGYALSVTKSGTGSGTITSTPAGISCGTSCSANYPAGTSVTLTAKPAAGTTFTGWNGACVGMAHKTCTVTMNGSQNVSASFTGSSHLYQETSATYQGNWIVSKCPCYSGGTDKYTTVKGAFTTFTFTGKLIQFVSERSVARGSFKVYIDGVLKGTVSNYSTVPQNAVVVWQHSFTASGKHTLKIVNVGTSGHNRIDADAFVVGT